MTARIYSPTRNAMQSGMKNSRTWILEHIAKTGKSLDPLMGWTGSSDMDGQVKLKFATQNEAVAYAKCHDLAYIVTAPQARKKHIKAYADIFAYRG